MVRESRASALNPDNYSPQRAHRCIDFECLQNIGKGEVVKAVCKSLIKDLLSGLNSYVLFTNRTDRVCHAFFGSVSLRVMGVGLDPLPNSPFGTNSPLAHLTITHKN